jgi:ribonucleotide monophosphatase NagD (HAD superfamily)
MLLNRAIPQEPRDLPTGYSTYLPTLMPTVCGKPTVTTFAYAERALLAYHARPRTKLAGAVSSHDHDEPDNNSSITQTMAPTRPITTVYMVGDNPESDIIGANAFEASRPARAAAAAQQLVLQQLRNDNTTNNSSSSSKSPQQKKRRQSDAVATVLDAVAHAGAAALPTWKSVLVETGVYVAGTAPSHRPTMVARDVRDAVVRALAHEGVEVQGW